ncbi:hypothetical protein [Nocardia miyunensis]|uniref:hypothetical protein n=1 Tax=Nocardia miyunensis TaxID=282684 RepID=UPI000A91AE60|nr:hypothetical protein [Nocardia miyunensis]
MREPLSPDEQRRNFERSLASVLAGGGLTTGSGLDDETERALWAVADAHPQIPEELVRAARTAFEAQLDGSHAAARLAELTRRIEEINRR